MNRLPQQHLGRAGLAGFLLLLLLGSLAPAREGAAQATGGRSDRVYPMVFPVAGDHVITDSFGDPRGGGRSHAGVDIMAEKMVPVVAVADGEIGWVFAERGGNCCDVSMIHEDGWRSRYIHLNNDTPGTDDGRAVGIAPGVREGAKVVAGQVIGWVGDSGNAEHTAPHLHFELRRPDGTPVDPYPSLLAAKRSGRPLVAPPRRPDGREERSPGLWDRLRGRDAGERPTEPVPDPPPTPGPGPGDPRSLVPPPEEDSPRVPLEESEEGVPASSAGLAMAPGAPVELVVLDDDCCGDRIGPAEVAKEERAGGWLGCLGFGKRKAAEGS